MKALLRGRYAKFHGVDNTIQEVEVNSVDCVVWNGTTLFFEYEFILVPPEIENESPELIKLYMNL